MKSASAILIVLVASHCGGNPFELVQPLPTEDSSPPPRSEYVIPEAASPQEATTPTAYDVRDVPDAGSWYSDSGSISAVGIDGGVVDSAVEATAGRYEIAEAAPPEAGCPPPVAPDGFSNVCATYPMRGTTYISTFPGECACDWTCACLMKSSICPGGRPQSCQWVNGSVCNSIVLAAVVCN